MPNYDYKCEECEHVFEEFHSISAEPEYKCPKCNGKTSKQIGKGLHVEFKGKGFYCTDYSGKAILK